MGQSHCRSLFATVAALAATFYMIAFFYFCIIEKWNIALWCLGAAMIVYVVALVLAREEF